MVKDHDDANDVMQNTFLKVWKGLENFRAESQLFTWVYRIATNETITFLNAKNKRVIISFDGNDYISGENFPNPGANGNVTIVAWLKPGNIAVQNTLFSATGPSCTAVQVGMTGGVMRAQKAISVGGGLPEAAEEGGDPGGPIVEDQPLTQDRVISNNTWQNVAYVFNNGTISTFVNGSLKGVVNGIGTANCPGASWVIGVDGTTLGYGYEGLMDDMRIYGSAFTASEIQKIYAQESNKYATTLVSR
jgi:hypothetical protein